MGSVGICTDVSCTVADFLLSKGFDLGSADGVALRGTDISTLRAHTSFTVFFRPVKPAVGIVRVHEKRKMLCVLCLENHPWEIHICGTSNRGTAEQLGREITQRFKMTIAYGLADSNNCFEK